MRKPPSFGAYKYFNIKKRRDLYRCEIVLGRRRSPPFGERTG